MELSKLGYCALANYECVCLKPYLDSGGVKTVGIGSTKSDIPDLALWDWNKEITIEEAVALYKKGLSKYIAGVNRYLIPLSIPQTLFDALVSITYNIGIGRLPDPSKKIKGAGMAASTFMKRVNAGDSLERIVQAMALWNKDNGKVVQGLINRRAKEARLILKGDYGTEGLVDLVPVINKKPAYSKGKKIDLMQYL